MIPVFGQPIPSQPAVIQTAAWTVGDSVTLDAIVTSIALDQGQVCVSCAGGQSYQIKAQDADIIVPPLARAGSLKDLSAGMHVHVIGEHGSGTAIHADRIRVTPAAEETADPTAPKPPVVDLSTYTGILIDTQAQAGILRSRAPVIYGPDMATLYPDRSHVPNPDEVQDESVIRYYCTTDAAAAGVGGAHPLILTAQKVVGPASDSVVLSADDAALFKALDQRLHYSLNWKVGFLVPGSH
jgi:hypothetical protein